MKSGSKRKKQWANDRKEQQSITLLREIFESSKYVRHRLDDGKKEENRDGYIDVLNQDADPIGQFEVQVKSIKPGRSGKPRYQCSVALVDHSNNNSGVPFLLICVDLQNRAAFWKRIHKAMPECKADQGSFVVYFDPKLEIIDHTEVFVPQWTEILQMHNRMLEKVCYNELSIADTLPISNALLPQLANFQTYLDIINSELDTNLTKVKSHYFPTVWKFGVNVISADETSVTYEMYSVHKGTNAPLITNNPPIYEDPSTWYYSRIFQKEPIKHGYDFLTNIMDQAISDRVFDPSGTLVCEENIFAFIDRFGEAVGIVPGDHVLLEVLHQKLASILADKYQEIMRVIKLDGLKVDASDLIILDETSAHKAPHLRIGHSPVFIIDDFLYGLKFILKCIDTLLSNNLTESRRLYKIFGPLPLWLGEGFDNGMFNDNLRVVLMNSLHEYKKFLEKNALESFGVRRFDPSKRVVCVPKINSQPHGLHLELPVFVVEDEHQRLPNISIVGVEALCWEMSKGRDVTINGQHFKLHTLNWLQHASFIQSATPLTDLLYYMLDNDYKKCYKPL